MSTLTKIIVIGGAILLGGFLIIQIVPYGRNHTNPPVVSEPNWDSPETRAIAERACFDCHSNETQYPWYASVAPVSWLVAHDAEEGRAYLNFSEWGSAGQRQEIDDIGKVIRSGEMPPKQYLLLHPGAKLTSDEQQALIQGLSRTTGQSIEGGSSTIDADDDGD